MTRARSPIPCTTLLAALLAGAVVGVFPGALPGDLAAQGRVLPTPEALAARHDSLVGGRALLETKQSVRMLGTFTLAAAGIDAPLEILKVRPNKYLFRTNLGQMGEILSGYDGNVAWAIQPGQGPLVLTGDQAAQVAEQADFFGDLHDFARFTKSETEAEIVFQERPAYRVRFERRNGTIVHEYFDVETGLSLGGSTTVESALGKLEMVTILSEYKEFGGVRVATRVVQQNPQFNVVLSIALVEYDTIDSTAVALPESVKALVKP